MVLPDGVENTSLILSYSESAHCDGFRTSCSANSGMKIVAFYFTKYGLINAEVVDIGNDAVEDQQAGAI